MNFMTQEKVSPHQIVSNPRKNKDRRQNNWFPCRFYCAPKHTLVFSGHQKHQKIEKIMILQSSFTTTKNCHNRFRLNFMKKKENLKTFSFSLIKIFVWLSFNPFSYMLSKICLSFDFNHTKTRKNKVKVKSKKENEEIMVIGTKRHKN